MKEIDILGVKISRISREEIFTCLAEWVRGEGRHYIVTPNPEFVIAAQEKPDFKKVVNQADIAVPDGIGLICASRLLYGRRGLSKRITGVDLMKDIARWAADNDANIFLLGAGPGVADQCAQRLQKAYPGLRVLGTYEGKAEAEFDPVTRQAIKKRINGQVIDILFVAYGAERQEKWIARNLDKLPVKVAMGVGGAFDFISGKVKRAPLWCRTLGLEWLWRLILQPWRWRRQLAIPRFISLVLKKKLANG